MRIRLAILVTLAACLAGCKDRDVERLAEVKRNVCACKDAQCADQAMSALKPRAAPAPGEPAPSPSVRSTPRTQAIARDIVECRARLEAADRPSTDPDAEGSAGDSEGSAPPAGSAAPAPANAAPAPAKAAR